MRTNGLQAICLVIGAALLSSCGGTPSPRALPGSTVSLVEAAARGCAAQNATPQERELCSFYYDLRILAKLGNRLDEMLASRFQVVPVPCLADGPDCLWNEAYRDLYRTQLGVAFGDPTPQPSTPLPFDRIPATVQLERAVAMRDGLMKAVTDLDGEIEVLRAAVNQVGEVH